MILNLEPAQPGMSCPRVETVIFTSGSKDIGRVWYLKGRAKLPVVKQGIIMKADVCPIFELSIPVCSFQRKTTL